MFSPWTILIAIGIAVAGFVAGIKVESDHRDAQLLEQERAQHRAFIARAEELRNNAQNVDGLLDAEQRARRQQRQGFDRQLEEAKRARTIVRVTNCQDADDGGAGARVGINVRLWNDALRIGARSSRDPGTTHDAADRAGYADAGRALDNLAENADHWAECRSALMGWQDLARRNGWVKPSANQ